MDLSHLNPQQKQAVLQTEGPVLVLAGAGSGKTRVIAHRVAWLLKKGVEAKHILAVTFTNKAALEMRERIAKLAAGLDGRAVTVSTFHSFGMKLVREQHGKLGLPAKFAILDSGDQVALVKRLLRDFKIDDKRFDVPRVVAILSRLRMEGRKGHEDDEYELCARELLPKYELGLRAMGAVDFDDLLLLPLKLFREHPSSLQRYQDKYRYLLVDEYQDTNAAQLKLLELLAGVRRNLCVVGDDDQSIYAWRGAQAKQILQFDRKFPGCVEIFLEQNYRSAGNILAAANAVIGKNPGRKPKKLWTDRGRGSNLRLVVAADDAAEAKFVADEIGRLRFEEKLPSREMAILYRTNAQARPFEEALRLAGIRYRVVGGTSLFDRKEVRDLLAYLRAALNPRDEVSLLRIVNVPARGIGDQTVARAQELARERKRPVWEIFHEEPRTQAFVELMKEYGERLARPGFSLAARELVEEVGLFEEARRSAQSGAAQARRVEAIEGLLANLIAYEQRTESGEPRDLSKYLQALALVSRGEDRGSAPDRAEAEGRSIGDDSDAVTLITLHGAKGLEWKCVFLCGLEEGLLPHSGRGFDSADPAAADGVGNLEEERRLCYVGLTRARERLTLTRAVQRVRRGKPMPRTPSRFLEDIPPDLLDVIDLGGPQPESPRAVQDQKAKSFFASMSEMLGEAEEG
ncbi:MAG TPA: UvrD-helicase domain-containing protein [Myxococcales bacterium]|nr:UvrD-helicase domain-containing protein [Myxococcales bacterium]